MVDQQFPGTQRTYGAFGGVVERAETFTVGIAGRLTSFDVLLWVASSTYDPALGPDLTWSIFATDGVTPYETPLASGILKVDLTGETMVSVDTSQASIFVTPGQVLALAVGNTSPSFGDQAFFIYGESASENSYYGLYPGGSSFLRVTDGSDPLLVGWTREEDVDWTFTTYVDPAAVPEPTASLLLVLSAAALLRVRAM
jgi:hypothetical protein